MKREDVLELLRAYARIDAEYHSWRDAMLQKAAPDAAGRDEAWRKIVDSYERTLADIADHEAAEVIRELELRQLQPLKRFDFGNVAGFFRTEALRVRAQRADRERQEQATRREQSWHCLTCQDSGIVTVWHPEFVVDFREQFDRLTAAKPPRGWFGAANHWWRAQGRGPAIHAALCDCDCPRRQSLRKLQTEWIEGRRKSPPACGMARYNPDTMPLATANRLRDLQQWYEPEGAE